MGNVIMATRDYCYYCDKDTEITIKEKLIPMEIGEKEFTFTGDIAYCKECGNEIDIPAISDENIRRANEKYREILGIIKVNEIDELLKKYKIGQKPLAKLLGWGEATIVRYLQGLMPSKVYSDRLKELTNPYNMQELYEKNKDMLTDIAKKKLETSIQEAMMPTDSLKQKNDMKSAMDVAKYFLKRVDVESGESITHLKLQKMVYYAQAWALAFLENPIFSEEIEAWQHGPVVPSLYFYFKDFGYDPIPKIAVFNEAVFNEEEIYILETVWNVYSKFDAKHLERITHSEEPWKVARGDCEEDDKSNAIIGEDNVKEFYKSIREKYNINSTEDLDRYVCNLRVN